MNGWSLGKMGDREAVLRQLVAGGLSAAAARGKARSLAEGARILLDAGHPVSTPVNPVYVPGRIEVLGKHTDYAGGRSLLVAVEKGFCAIAAPRRDAAVTMFDVLDQERIRFELAPDLNPTTGHWANYPMTVGRRLARNFPAPLCGADVAFASDLPRAAGMSSSSALVVATFLVLCEVNRLPATEQYARNIRNVEDLAGYLGTIENGLSFGTLAGDRGVGTFGGSEDHTAMLCAGKDRLVQYSYCPVRYERSVAVADNHVFVIADSGVVADKTGSAMEKYNRVSRLAGAVLELWRGATRHDEPHLAAAVTTSPDAADRIRDVLVRSRHPVFSTKQLLDRLEQFLVESEQIVPAVADTLAGSQLARFGELVDRSQALGASLLGNQTPETIWLAEQARRLGAVAASAFGAGFGGSVWALLPQVDAERFQQDWSSRYREAFPEPAARGSFFVTRAGPGAFRFDASPLLS